MQRSILAQPIEDVLDLSVRTSNCLREANIVNFAQLIGKSISELKKIKGFGNKSLNELRTKLSRIGLSLNEEH